ncbi:DUF6493 family protein [Streptomyces sp. NPDC058001]|uniref:DUF6493 family protein n=1 Tax=Streptomyces sp. NPDC058001 TaxID=3346300 RepID=UPI0036E3F2FF
MSTELLMPAVRSGRMTEAVDLLNGMTAAERRTYLPELKSLRKELRSAPWSAETRRTHPVLHAAGAACHSGVVAAATWIAGADMRWSQASPGVLLRLLGERDPRWLGDLAHKLADRPVSSSVPYGLMSGLVRRAGCEAPTTDAYVQGWMDDTSGMWQRGTVLAERLRGDPHLVPLVTAMFETDDIGSRIEWTYGGEEAHSWTAALVRLTEDGVLDRKVMIEACVARLLRGGPLSDHRAFLRLLKALSPTREEERERLADWTALASDAPSLVATHAQSVLGALAHDGEMTHRQLAEMSRGVLFRTEKKLVRTQLILLGKVLRAAPDAAPVLLPAVADAFGHEDTDLQERALKLVERHLDQADPDARDELAGALEQLSPGLRPRAAEALGVTPTPDDTEPYTEVLPPPPERRRVPPAPGSAAEVAEETGALLESGGGVSAFERVLDGLVRHACTDRAALMEALGPLMERQWWHGTPKVWRTNNHFSDEPHGVEVILATLFDDVRTVTLQARILRGAMSRECAHTALSRPLKARLWEAAYRIRTEPVPFLLATPTWESGVLELEELVARLTEYRRLGARPGEADFAQALLRVRRDPAVAGAATALGTAEGDRLGRWLSGGPARPRTSALRTSGDRILVQVDEDTELTEWEKQLPRAFANLGAEVTVPDRPRTCYHWSYADRAHWLAVVPGRRDVVAAVLLKQTSDSAVEDTGDDPAYLPLLAETDGEAGDAVHLAVAYGLGARRSDERLAAVDALLVLAARGQLDADLLGGALGRLLVSGAVKPLRLVESGRAAAATGAYATTWSVLREALVPLLTAFAEGRSAGVRGAGDLLAVAAECAERTGARGAIPRLAEVAERGGSSRLVTQARRLHKALGAETTR